MRGRAVGEEMLELAALWEVCRSLGRLVPVAEYLAKRAAMKGVFLAVSYERFLYGSTARATVTFRLIQSNLDEKSTLKYVRVRARALQKFLSVIKKDLEKKGIRCDMKTWLNWEFGPGIAYAAVHVEAVPAEIDAARIFSSKMRRCALLYGAPAFVGGVRSSFIKQMEAAAAWEDERGAALAALPEVVGAAEEGGGEEAAGDTGVDIVSDREAAERGYVRMHEAVLKYGVPLVRLAQLVEKGAVRSFISLDEKRRPAIFVKEEDVKRVAELLKTGEEGGGGGG